MYLSRSLVTHSRSLCVICRSPFEIRTRAKLSRENNNVRTEEKTHLGEGKMDLTIFFFLFFNRGRLVLQKEIFHFFFFFN